MVNPRQTIKMQGVEVELLITPSLYKRSLTDGLDLTLHDPEDAAEYVELFDHVKKIGEGAANSPFQTADSDPEPQQ